MKRILLLSIIIATCLISLSFKKSTVDMASDCKVNKIEALLFGNYCPAKPDNPRAIWSFYANPLDTHETHQNTGIKWLSWEEGMELNKRVPKNLLVYVFADWDGWSKRMDTTFLNAKVIAYINQNFHCIKLNAETKKKIEFNGNTFEFVPSEDIVKYPNAGVHTLVYALLDGKLGYPSLVFLNNKMERIMVSPGFKKPGDLLPELEYVAKNDYLNDTWEDYIEKRSKQLNEELKTKIDKNKYDEIRQFKEGLAVVVKNNKSGYIDEDGNEVIPLIYYAADDILFGLARVMSDKSTMGMLDKTGKILIPIIYKRVADGFQQDRLQVWSKDGKCGFVDRSGKVVIPVIYEYADNFHGSSTKVTLNGESFNINVNGERIK